MVDTNSPDVALRDWILRTLPSGQIVDLSGFGIEVIRANPIDPTGRLYTSMTRDGFDSPFSEDAFLITTPGARRIGQFRYLKYIGVQSVPTAGSVTVRVYTKDRCVYPENDPPGKQRTIFFNRNQAGGLSLGTGVAQNIVDTTLLPLVNPITPDPFWTDELPFVRMYWYGYIASTGAFNVYTGVQHNPNDLVEPFKIHGAFNTRTTAASAAVLLAMGGAATNVNICDFTTGTNAVSSQNTASCRQPIPPGNIRMTVENTAGAPITVFYSIGACSHL